MNFKRHGILAGIAITATLALTACGSDNETPSTTGSNGGSARPPPSPAQRAH